MELKYQVALIAQELIAKAKLKEGNVVIVGCSTSEVVGEKIGTNSTYDIAQEIFEGLYYTLKEQGIFLAVQCCEHLNRAIVIERGACPNAEQVNVVPQPKAGGSLATAAYKNMQNAIVIENVKADAGIDIGDTFIGMHLKSVAVPLRLSTDTLGKAHVTFARTRPKFIGGIRAIYDDKLL
jgi:uncharacterized protein (TIGR01440 family)